jgi:hypothetical protein
MPNTTLAEEAGQTTEEGSGGGFCPKIKPQTTAYYNETPPLATRTAKNVEDIRPTTYNQKLAYLIG